MKPLHPSLRTWGPLLLAITVTLTLGWLLKAPCRSIATWNGDQYARLCYTDFIPQWSLRHLDQGKRPYIEEVFEYPVLSGGAAMLAAVRARSARDYYDHMALLLAIAALIAVWGQAQRLDDRRRALAFAAAPTIVLYAFHNFELFACATSVLGLLYLRRERWLLAGLFFGAGAAFKLYPGVLGAGAAVVLLFSTRWRAALRVGVATAGTFVLANLPFALLNFSTWLETYRFHSRRVPDWGAITYWLSRHFGLDLVRLGHINDAAMILGVLLAAGVLAWWTRRRGTDVETGAAFLLVVFVLTNKVWSPQFMLWLLPVVIADRLSLGWWVALSVVDVAAYAGVFQWFASPAGVNELNGWAHLFEAAVWTRFVLVGLFAVRLLRGPFIRLGALCRALPDLLLPRPAPPPVPSRGPIARLWWIAVVPAALLLSFRLGDPPASYTPGQVEYVHDECYQAFTAHRYAIGDSQAWNPRADATRMRTFDPTDVRPNAAYEWVHPPSAKLVMAGLIRLFGFLPEVYRAGSVLFGLLTILATAMLARSLFGPGTALVAGLLLALDGMLFVMSRVAMNDIYVTGALVCAVFAYWRAWTAEHDRTRWMLGCGALFGLAMSMKWNAAAPWAGLAAIALIRVLYLALVRRSPGWRLGRELALWTAAFVVVPVALYVASYWAYFAAGYGWGDFVVLHREIVYYHGHLKATHSQGSPWYTWPFMGKPVWLFVHYGPEAGMVRSIYAFGNPLLWFAFLPAVGYTLVRALRDRSSGDALVACCFLGLWLPWSFVGRVAFVQYLLPAVPFATIAIARAVRDTWQRGRWWRPLSALYLTACLAAFVNFYPLLSALPVPAAELAGHRWFWLSFWRS